MIHLPQLALRQRPRRRRVRRLRHVQILRRHYLSHRPYPSSERLVSPLVSLPSSEDARVRLGHDVLFQSLPARVQFGRRRPSPRRVSRKTRLRSSQERLHASSHARGVSIGGVIFERGDERLDVPHERARARLTHLLEKGLKRERRGRRGRHRHLDEASVSSRATRGGTCGRRWMRIDDYYGANSARGTRFVERREGDRRGDARVRERVDCVVCE